LVKSILNSSRIGAQSTLAEYLLEDDCRQCLNKVAEPETPSRDYKYKQDHMRLFDAASLAWPPAAGHCDGIDASVGQRDYELIVYANEVFPYDPVASKWQPQYLDFGSSLIRVAGIDGKLDPWSMACPTLTTTCTIAARWAEPTDTVAEAPTDAMDMSDMRLFDQPPPPFKLHLRQLDGVELLQLVGLPLSEYRGECPSHDLATLMAGNAFSGFAVGPCLLAAVAAMLPLGSVDAPAPQIDDVSDDDFPEPL
jgi:hypothetical protein